MDDFWADPEEARAVVAQIEVEIGRSREMVTVMRGMQTPSFSELGQVGHDAVVDARAELADAMQKALEELERTAEKVRRAMRSYQTVDETGATRLSGEAS